MQIGELTPRQLRVLICQLLADTVPEKLACELLGMDDDDEPYAWDTEELYDADDESEHGQHCR